MLSNTFSIRGNWKKFILLILIVSAFSYLSLQRTERIDWDVFGYYLYLPAKFIHNDINLQHKAEWLEPAIIKYKLTESFYQAYQTPSGKYVFKYTMGMAILYTPFFLAANTFALHTNYSRDGFSLPYQIAMRLFVLLMIFIGIFFLYKILLLYFSENIALLTLFILVFGTNYYVMSFADGLMPHLSLFSIFTALLHFTIKWYRKQKVKYAIIIGFCVGIAVLIRPTSVVVAIVPLLWGIKSFNDIKERIQLFKKYFLHLTLLLLFAFLVVLPQLIYWKMQTGQWLFYSYPDEKLNLFTPHLTEVLFSYKKGWLLYTPLMFFALVGFYPFYIKYKAYFFSIIIFILINTYIISAWDCWWYGGSFAHRAFVESYVFMAFPLASLLENILKRISFYTLYIKCFLLSSFFFLLLFIIFLNIFQTQQALNGIIHTSRTTKEYYWKIFLKNSVNEKDKIWLEPEPYYSREDELHTEDYYVTDSLIITEIDFENNNAEFSCSISPMLNVYTDYKHKVYLRFTANIEALPETSEQHFFMVSAITLNGKLFQYRSKEFSKSDILNNNGQLGFTIFVPPQVSLYKSDLKCYVYNPNRNSFEIVFLKTEVLKSKLGLTDVK